VRHDFTNRSHTRHNHATSIANLRRRFWVSLALTVPILALSQPIQNVLDLHWDAFSKNSYVLLVLSALLFCYGGWPFLSGLAGELSSWQPGMMTLVGFLSPSRSSTRALSHSAARQSVFLGVGHPHRYHAARPLDRNEISRWGLAWKIAQNLLWAKHRQSNCLRINELSVLAAPAKAGYNNSRQGGFPTDQNDRSRRRLEYDFSCPIPHQGISLVRLFKMALVITKISEINRAISSTIRATRIAFCIFVSISNGPLKSLYSDATPETQ
jgi:hypothetical protein